MYMFTVVFVLEKILEAEVVSLLICAVLTAAQACELLLLLL